jgi:ribonuclease HI
MWQKTNNSLYKKFEFKNFSEAFGFMQKVAELAERFQHHPKWTNEYNKVEIWLSTHDAGNTVTEKDEHLAQEIDLLLADNKPSESEGTLTITEAKLFTDGGSRGNPGPAALGYVILDMEDNVVKKEGAYLGITTNNQAEYAALKSGLQGAKDLGVQNLEVYMDSQLIVNQINGIYKIKNQELLPLYQASKALAADFQMISFTHVPRELNKLADAAVNEALDARMA